MPYQAEVEIQMGPLQIWVVTIIYGHQMKDHWIMESVEIYIIMIQELGEITLFPKMGVGPSAA